MYSHNKTLSFKDGLQSVLWLFLLMALSGLPFYFLYTSGFISESLMVSLGYATGCIVFIAVVFKVSGKDIRRFVSTPVPFYVYPVAVVMTLCMNMVIDPFSYFYPIPDWLHHSFQKLSSDKFLFFTGSVVMAPVLEEIIFRGLLLGGLLLRYPKWQALLYSAILFSIVHLNPAQSFGAVFLGLLAGWAYIKFRNLLIPVTLHSTNNLLCWYMMTKTTLKHKNSFFECFSSDQSYFLAVTVSFILLLIIFLFFEKQYRQPAAPPA